MPNLVSDYYVPKKRNFATAATPKSSFGNEYKEASRKTEMGFCRAQEVISVLHLSQIHTTMPTLFYGTPILVHRTILLVANHYLLKVQ